MNDKLDPLPPPSACRISPGADRPRSPSPRMSASGCRWRRMYWFRPLCLSVTRGYWMNLLRVRKSGVLSRHRHPQPVHGFVLRGEWRYLEQTGWRARAAMSMRAPGETHTLLVDPHVEEMITLFQVNGAMILCLIPTAMSRAMTTSSPGSTNAAPFMRKNGLGARLYRPVYPLTRQRRFSQGASLHGTAAAHPLSSPSMEDVPS